MRPTRILLAIPLLAGCYAYQPAAGTPTPAGDRVRLTFTDSGARNLAAQIGPSIQALSGELVLDSAGMYFVTVRSTTRQNGVETDWSGEQVEIPHPFVALVERRRFSRTRSVVTGAAAIVLGLLVREAFWGPGGVFGGAPPGGGQPPR